MNRLYQLYKLLYLTAALFIINACSSFTKPTNNILPAKIQPLKIEEPNPEDTHGNPKQYTVYGHTYHVLPTSEGFEQTGKAKIYPPSFKNRQTTSGQPYDPYQLTAAHKRLPLPSYIKITNLDNHKSTKALVNDRGPFDSKAIVNISPAIAYRLDITPNNINTTNIKIEGIRPYSTLERTKKYYLQLALFKSKKQTEQVQTYLSKIFGFNNASVVQIKKDGAVLYGLRVGPFDSKKRAKQYMNKHLNALPMMPAIIEK